MMSVQWKRSLQQFVRIQDISKATRTFNEARCIQTAAPLWSLPSNGLALSSNDISTISKRNLLLGFELRAFLSTTTGGDLSLFQVLNIQTSATKEDIKRAFRELAKQYHPDMNHVAAHSLSRSEAESKMAQIINAYEQLMDDDLFGRVGNSSKVAFACEVYTIEELRLDRLHDVYAIQVMYEHESDIKDTTDLSKPTSTSTAMSKESVVPILTHPDDSVSDLKRHLQELMGREWGLHGRRVDRDGISFGWELVYTNQPSPDATLPSKSFSQTVLSYHLFLHDYNIQHGQTVYAVVRKQEQPAVSVDDKETENN